MYDCMMVVDFWRGRVFGSVDGMNFEEVLVFILAFAQAGESRLASV
jgi:hypothetical protein